MVKSSLTTEALASMVGVKAQTIRRALCRHGSYFGLKPVKMPNRFLLWPADSVEQLARSGGSRGSQSGTAS